MATKKLTPYFAEVLSVPQFDDHKLIITERRSKSIVFEREGYSTRANAWRGFDRVNKKLFRPGSVEKLVKK